MDPDNQQMENVNQPPTTLRNTGRGRGGAKAFATPSHSGVLGSLKYPNTRSIRLTTSSTSSVVPDPTLALPTHQPNATLSSTTVGLGGDLTHQRDPLQSEIRQSSSSTNTSPSTNHLNQSNIPTSQHIPLSMQSSQPYRAADNSSPGNGDQRRHLLTQHAHTTPNNNSLHRTSSPSHNNILPTNLSHSPTNNENDILHRIDNLHKTSPSSNNNNDNSYNNNNNNSNNGISLNVSRSPSYIETVISSLHQHRRLSSADTSNNRLAGHQQAEQNRNDRNDNNDSNNSILFNSNSHRPTDIPHHHLTEPKGPSRNDLRSSHDTDLEGQSQNDLRFSERNLEPQQPSAIFLHHHNNNINSASQQNTNTMINLHQPVLPTYRQTENQNRILPGHTARFIPLTATGGGRRLNQTSEHTGADLNRLLTSSPISAATSSTASTSMQSSINESSSSAQSLSSSPMRASNLQTKRNSTTNQIPQSLIDNSAWQQDCHNPPPKAHSLHANSQHSQFNTILTSLQAQDRDLASHQKDNNRAFFLQNRPYSSQSSEPPTLRTISINKLLHAVNANRPSYLKTDSERPDIELASLQSIIAGMPQVKRRINRHPANEVADYLKKMSHYEICALTLEQWMSADLTARVANGSLFTNMYISRMLEAEQDYGLSNFDDISFNDDDSENDNKDVHYRVKTRGFLLGMLAQITANSEPLLLRHADWLLGGGGEYRPQANTASVSDVFRYSVLPDCLLPEHFENSVPNQFDNITDYYMQSRPMPTDASHPPHATSLSYLYPFHRAGGMNDLHTYKFPVNHMHNDQFDQSKSQIVLIYDVKGHSMPQEEQQMFARTWGLTAKLAGVGRLIFKSKTFTQMYIGSAQGPSDTLQDGPPFSFQHRTDMNSQICKELMEIGHTTDSYSEYLRMAQHTSREEGQRQLLDNPVDLFLNMVTKQPQMIDRLFDALQNASIVYDAMEMVKRNLSQLRRQLIAPIIEEIHKLEVSQQRIPPVIVIYSFKAAQVHLTSHSYNLFVKDIKNSIERLRRRLETIYTVFTFDFASIICSDLLHNQQRLTTPLEKSIYNFTINPQMRTRNLKAIALFRALLSPGWIPLEKALHATHSEGTENILETLAWAFDNQTTQMQRIVMESRVPIVMSEVFTDTAGHHSSPVVKQLFGVIPSDQPTADTKAIIAVAVGLLTSDIPDAWLDRELNRSWVGFNGDWRVARWYSSDQDDDQITFHMDPTESGLLKEHRAGRVAVGTTTRRMHYFPTLAAMMDRTYGQRFRLTASNYDTQNIPFPPKGDCFNICEYLDFTTFLEDCAKTEYLDDKDNVIILDMLSDHISKVIDIDRNQVPGRQETYLIEVQRVLSFVSKYVTDHSIVGRRLATHVSNSPVHHILRIIQEQLIDKYDYDHTPKEYRPVNYEPGNWVKRNNRDDRDDEDNSSSRKYAKGSSSSSKVRPTGLGNSSRTTYDDHGAVRQSDTTPFSSKNQRSYARPTLDNNPYSSCEEDPVPNLELAFEPKYRSGQQLFYRGGRCQVVAVTQDDYEIRREGYDDSRPIFVTEESLSEQNNSHTGRARQGLEAYAAHRPSQLYETTHGREAVQDVIKPQEDTKLNEFMSLVTKLSRDVEDVKVRPKEDTKLIDMVAKLSRDFEDVRAERHQIIEAFNNRKEPPTVTEIVSKLSRDPQFISMISPAPIMDNPTISPSPPSPHAGAVADVLTYDPHTSLQHHQLPPYAQTRSKASHYNVHANEDDSTLTSTSRTSLAPYTKVGVGGTHYSTNSTRSLDLFKKNELPHLIDDEAVQEESTSSDEEEHHVRSIQFQEISNLKPNERTVMTMILKMFPKFIDGMMWKQGKFMSGIIGLLTSVPQGHTGMSQGTKKGKASFAMALRANNISYDEPAFNNLRDPVRHMNIYSKAVAGIGGNYQQSCLWIRDSDPEDNIIISKLIHPTWMKALGRQSYLELLENDMSEQIWFYVYCNLMRLFIDTFKGKSIAGDMYSAQIKDLKISGLHEVLDGLTHLTQLYSMKGPYTDKEVIASFNTMLEASGCATEFRTELVKQKVESPEEIFTNLEMYRRVAKTVEEQNVLLKKLMIGSTSSYHQPLPPSVREVHPNNEQRRRARGSFRANSILDDGGYDPEVDFVDGNLTPGEELELLCECLSAETINAVLIEAPSANQTDVTNSPTPTNKSLHSTKCSVCGCIDCGSITVRENDPTKCSLGYTTQNPAVVLLGIGKLAQLPLVSMIDAVIKSSVEFGILKRCSQDEVGNFRDKVLQTKQRNDDQRVSYSNNRGSYRDQDRGAGRGQYYGGNRDQYHQGRGGGRQEYRYNNVGRQPQDARAYSANVFGKNL